VFKFREVTDLDMTVEYSKGDAVVEFKPGDRCRELFIIYEGPSFKDNKKEFLKQLQKYIEEQ